VRRRRTPLALALAVVLLALAPAVAHAEFGMVPGSLSIEMLDSDGNPETRAGAHPDRLVMGMEFNRLPDQAADGALRDLRFEFPPGFIGDPGATPICKREVLTLASWDECPPETQVGTVTIDVGLVMTLPLYNVRPRPGNVVEFGYKLFFAAGFLEAKIDSGGRLAVEMRDAIHDLPVASFGAELWGVPADHLPVEIPRRALLTAPTTCGVALETVVRYRPWAAPSAWHEATGALPPFEGCDELSFHPGFDFALERSTADSPTGAEIGLSLPPEAGPDGRSHDRIEALSLALPDGMTLALGVANTLQNCPETAVGLGSSAPEACPHGSRVGTLELVTPLLATPVTGNVYMGGQLPGGDFRLFAVARAPGLTLKLPVTLRPDPATGKLTTTIESIPALPLERLALRFDGGARSSLVTPLRCGPATATATLTSRGGRQVTVAAGAAVTGSVTGGACPAAPLFAPSFTAGALRAKAGAASPFAATIRRRDGDQPLRRFSLTLPKGGVARLAVAERCSEAAIALDTCPEASRIGTAMVEAGAGATPLVMRGKLFLTGPYRTTRPYRRSPVGLAIVLPGVAGPFDLGRILVRTGMRLDPRTGRVTIDSDPLPQVVRGIPLRLQTLGIDIDRPGFSSNPTSCSPSEVAVRLEAVDGAVVQRASRFAVGGCDRLRFRPRVAMALTGRREQRRDGNPGLRMRIRSATTGANISSATVAMPALLTGSPIGPAAICSLRQAAAGRCPDAARIGRTSARTPLLKRPLRGSVYLVQPRGKGLPDVWAMLAAEGIELRVRMRTSLDDGRMSGEIVDLPDVPLAAFTIDFASGKRGMFVAKRSPCSRGKPRAIRSGARLEAHSGAARKVTLRVGVAPGCRR
jgi:hypothetical protein